MTTENDNGSSAPAPESAAPKTEQQQEQPVVEAKKEEPTAKPDGKTPPEKMPTEAPPAGLEYVLGADGMWHTRRLKTDAEIAADYAKASEKDDAEEAAPTGAVELQIPEEVVRQGASGEDDTVLLSEASAMMSAAGYTAAQQQRLVEIYGLESMAHTDAPRAETHGQEAVLGYLREQWGSEYEARLDAAVAMTKKIGPKFERWLGETGLGDDPTMLSVLANVGRGLLSISKADAEKQIAEIRKNFQPHGKDHKLTVAKLRVLADRAARGEPDQEANRKTLATNFHRGVTQQVTASTQRSTENVIAGLREQQAEVKEKHGQSSSEYKALSAQIADVSARSGPSRSSQDVIGTLREQQIAVMKQHGRLSPEYKAVSAKVRAAYEQAYGTEAHRP